MSVYKLIKSKIEHLWHVFKRHILFDILSGNFAKPFHFSRSVIKSKLFDWPYLAMIETCNFCNLRCPTCTTPHSRIHRARAMMSFEDYKKIVDNIKNSVSVILPWFSNEPLLNPHLADMVNYAHKNNIYTVISTNAVLLDEKKSRQLLDSGLDEILLCLDGTHKESYEPFRRGADFDRVFQNIKKFCELKRKSGKRKPFVEMQFILTKLNQGEVGEIKKISGELGVDRLRIKSFALSEYAYTKDEIGELSERFLPDDLRYSAKIRYEKRGDMLEIKSRKKKCDLASSNMVILADGRAVMCCYDLNGEYSYGNVKEKNLKDFWRAEDVKRRRMVAEKRGYDLCKVCAN